MRFAAQCVLLSFTFIWFSFRFSNNRIKAAEVKLTNREVKRSLNLNAFILKVVRSGRDITGVNVLAHHC